jgi:zinc transport system permease protein
VFQAASSLLETLVVAFTELWPEGTWLSLGFNVYGLLATLAVCLICGAMGALVVGNRMAFFSDALAHCAFAGVGLGLLICLLLQTSEDDFRQSITLIMVLFGITIGLLIAYVREQSGLASDTVIGVFYAGAIGLAAVFTRMYSEQRRLFSIEDFIFGNPITARPWEILLLLLLALATAGFLYKMYNPMVMASVSPSLARSRRVPVRLLQYALIVLLGLMVNLSLQIVGTLLINGLLIVPAATAANLSRNLRQMFWYSIILAVFAGFAGSLLSWEVNCHSRYKIGVSGSIVVLSVVLFAASLVVGALLRRHRPRAEDEGRPALAEEGAVNGPGREPGEGRAT